MPIVRARRIVDIRQKALQPRRIAEPKHHVQLQHPVARQPARRPRLPVANHLANVVRHHGLRLACHRPNCQRGLGRKARQIPVRTPARMPVRTPARTHVWIRPPPRCYTRPFRKIPARALVWRPWMPDFQPFVSPAEKPPEFTLRAILLGCFFGLVFGAVTVYVGLRAGLTVAASIPIAVLSISILRAFGRASILENNIVQTTGNAGQSIAAGVIFTLPALIFLGFDLEYARIFLLALFGGWLGVLFMIPLRRQLIVEEHGALTYPEGTACADVLEAGERGGSFASRVFLGLGLGGLYTLFQNDNLFSLWPSQPDYQPNLGAQHLLKGSAIRADCTSEYLGVGYIIGLRVSAVMLAGGVFSWLVLMPAIYFFGSHLTSPIYPGTTLIRDMTPSDLWSTYVRPMGAGAVAASGLITLLRTAPTIFTALTEGLGSMGKNRSGKNAAAKTIRTERDIPMPVVLGGSAVLVILMWAFLQF